MKFFSFLTKWKFYVHLAIIIALLVIAFEATFSYLDKYTRHGEEFEVPDLVGWNSDEVIENHKDDFNFVLIDSLYVKDYPEGSILQQDPPPGSKVKKGRNFYYVIVSKSPEKVPMPNLRNLSLRQAIVSLEEVGLVVSKLEFIQYFARNAVVEQYYDSDVIEPGTMINRGASVDLTVGYGDGDKMTHVPDLVGVRLLDAKSVLHNASLNLGNVIYMDNDDMMAYRIFRMDPAYSQETVVTLGDGVNVWCRSENNFDFDMYMRNLFVRDSLVNALKDSLSPYDLRILTDSIDNLIYKAALKNSDTILSVDDLLDFGHPVDSDINDIDFEIDTNYYYEE